MTYNVFSGTLNPTQSILLSLDHNYTEGRSAAQCWLVWPVSLSLLPLGGFEAHFICCIQVIFEKPQCTQYFYMSLVVLVVV